MNYIHTNARKESIQTTPRVPEMHMSARHMVQVLVLTSTAPWTNQICPVVWTKPEGSLKEFWGGRQHIKSTFAFDITARFLYECAIYTLMVIFRPIISKLGKVQCFAGIASIFYTPYPCSSQFQNSCSRLNAFTFDDCQVLPLKTCYKMDDRSFMAGILKQFIYICPIHFELKKHNRPISWYN